MGVEQQPAGINGLKDAFMVSKGPVRLNVGGGDQLAIVEHTAARMAEAGRGNFAISVVGGSAETDNLRIEIEATAQPNDKEFFARVVRVAADYNRALLMSVVNGRINREAQVKDHIDSLIL